MPEIELSNNPITVELTANAAISDKEVVGAVGNNACAPISDTDAQAVVGVADGAASSGETVEVVVLGKKNVVADGAVDPGDPVRAAATAGRCVAEQQAPTSHSHDLPADSSGTTVNAELDGSGNLAVADGSGQISAADAGVDHGRTFGKAITSASAAGDEITVLVALTA